MGKQSHKRLQRWIEKRMSENDLLGSVFIPMSDYESPSGILLRIPADDLIVIGKKAGNLQRKTSIRKTS